MPAGSPNSQSSSPSSCSEQLSKTNLYIRKLPPETTDKNLVLLCQEYGKIISTKAIIDQETNLCKGYGFVDFEMPQAASAAVRALQAKGYQAQMARQQEQDPTNLYVANLPPHISEQDLENMFRQYGQVISTRILRDNAGNSRGVGFARMESKEKCDAVINAYHGKSFAGSGLKEPLTVKYADCGNKKKNQGKQWTDKSFEPQRGITVASLEQLTSAMNGLAPSVLTTPGLLRAGYTLQTPQLSGYQLPPTSWVQPYIVPTAVPQYMHGIPNGYTTVAYPSTHGAPILQAFAFEDPATGITMFPTSPDDHHHFPSFGQPMVK